MNLWRFGEGVLVYLCVWGGGGGGGGMGGGLYVCKRQTDRQRVMSFARA